MSGRVRPGRVGSGLVRDGVRVVEFGLYLTGRDAPGQRSAGMHGGGRWRGQALE